MIQMYDGSQNAAQYVESMMAAYNAGKNGTRLEEHLGEMRGITVPQAQAAYIAGQADATGAQLAENGQKRYNEPKTGASDLESQLATHDTATVNGVKFSLRATGDGQYFLNIDRDTAVMGGYIDDARSHIYDAGPFASRSEAVQEALDFIKEEVYALPPEK